MKGGKIVLTTLILIVAFTILVITYYAEVTKNKQRIHEQNVPSPTSTILEIPQGSPTVRPVARPQSQKTTSPGPSIEDIREEIQKVFVDKEAVKWAEFIVFCESGYNPYAIGSGRYYGLFQYLPSTYKNCGGKDIYDWREQIMITKTCMYDHGRQNEFPACNRRFKKQ